jgi:hypothetical protein
MPVSRRDLIRLGTLAGTAALLPLPDLLAAPSTPPTAFTPTRISNLRWISRSRLRPLVTNSFVLRHGSGFLRLRLASVGDVPTAREGETENREDCFMAVFTVPGKGTLPQGTYTVTHRAFGSFPLFLVPNGRTPVAATYAAIFDMRTGSQLS